jgi:CBS domain-containing protein
MSLSPIGRAIDAVNAVDTAAELVSAMAAGRAAVAAVASAPVLTLAGAWSALARQATARAVDLVGAPKGGWSWHISGSLGRGEGLPGADVESLVVIEEGTDHATALSRAADVHALLDACGLPGDANGAVAHRSRFCRTHASWRDGLARWTHDPYADRGVVMLGIVLDSVAVPVGDRALCEAAGAAVRTTPGVLAAMLRETLAAAEPLPSGLRVLGRRDDRADLKRSVVNPIVKIARWAAVGSGGSAASTVCRLEEACGSTLLDDDEARMLRTCFAVATRIRWQTRRDAWLDGNGFNDDVYVNRLSPQDRTLLRAVGREVSGIRRKLAFLSSVSAFDPQ